MPPTATLAPAASIPTVGAELAPDDHVVVLFGGTGDLARRKLLPGLFRLAQAGLLPDRSRIIATSRGTLTNNEFRELANAAVQEFGRLGSGAAWRTFATNLSFASQETLVDAVARAEAELGKRAPEARPGRRSGARRARTPPLARAYPADRRRLFGGHRRGGGDDRPDGPFRRARPPRSGVRRAAAPVAAGAPGRPPGLPGATPATRHTRALPDRAHRRPDTRPSRPRA
jgi:hypothetical protein